MLKVKPILFNTEMVQAILDGRKTVTRRIIQPQPQMRLCYACAGYGHGKWCYPDKNVWEYWGEEFKIPDNIENDELKRTWTPPCHADDNLYVRETWFKDVGRYMYKADYSSTEKFYKEGKETVIRWRPSIHMPKEAARIYLKVTNVRVERLSDMKVEDAVAEGINLEGLVTDQGIIAYRVWNRWNELWDSTIPKRNMKKYGSEANPWVWVIEFERCEKPESCGGGYKP